MLRGEVGLFLIGGVLVASLLLREAQLFVVGLILLLVAGVSWVWERYCLVGLGYRRSLGQVRAMFGEEVSLTLEIVNDKPLPLAWLEIEDTVPGVGLTLAPAHVGPSHIPGRRLLGILLSVRWYERVRRHYRVTCRARGFHAFGPATLRTGDVFGLATQEIEIPGEDYLLVYPKIVPLERLGLPARNPFGDVPLRRQWLFEDPMRTVGVRDYRPGDSPRRLHWKATARAPGQALQVKLFEPTTTHRLHILLNISTGGPNWSWQGYDPEVLEAADRHGRVRCQLGNRTRLSHWPGGECQTVPLQRGGAHSTQSRSAPDDACARSAGQAGTHGHHGRRNARRARGPRAGLRDHRRDGHGVRQSGSGGPAAATSARRPPASHAADHLGGAAARAAEWPAGLRDSSRGHAVNRLSLTLGLAAMDLCWVTPWAVLLGLWTDLSRPRALLSPPSVFALVLLGALTTQTLGRRAVHNRAAALGLVGLGVLAVLLAVRLDQYPGGAAWNGWGSIAAALAAVLGQASGPALAFALGLFLWWRGVRLGSQMASFSDVESVFRWGIGALVSFALLMAISTRPDLLPTIEAQTTPFVVGFFFVSLLTLALGRLESLRTRTRALAVNTQWLGVLIFVAGLVVLVALVIGQLLSFDLLIVATRPLFDLLGQILLLAVYLIVIPLAYVVEWLVYLLLSLLPAAPNQQPPQLLQPGEIDNRLQNLFASGGFRPSCSSALKAAGAALLLVAALLVVARAASRWRRSSVDADATEEERDSLWEPGRLRRALLALWRKLFRRGAPASEQPATLATRVLERSASGELSSIRELYRQLLRLGESVGAPRAADTTPLEHLPSLQDSLEPADDAANLTQAYVRVRYAEVEPSPAEAEAAREQLARLRPRSSLDDG